MIEPVKVNQPTVSARDQIIEKLEEILHVNFIVVDQIAGIRPTVKDRRPLIGTHHVYNRVHLLNGMGSRGVLMAPWAAKQLFDHIEQNEILNFEIDLNRFRYLYT